MDFEEELSKDGFRGWTEQGWIMRRLSKDELRGETVQG